MMAEQDRISIDEYRRLAASMSSDQKNAPRVSKPALRLPKQKRETSFTAVLLRLMAPRSTGRLRLQPEEQLAVAFANALRQATIDGQLRAVWTHPANEIAGRRSGLAKIRYTIAKAMGLIDGTADYLFLASDTSGALEAKVGRNNLADNQKDFEAWCVDKGVRHATFRTVEEGLAHLSDWGMLKTQSDQAKI